MMNNGKKLLPGIILLVLLSFLIFGCSNHLKGTKGFTDISISLRLPDYHIRNFSGAGVIVEASAESLTSPRVVDPTTSTVEVTISASDMDTVTQTFNFADTGSFGSGVGEINCNVTDIPVGLSRQFDVVTKDAAGTVLTTGTVVSDVFLWAGSIGISLIPVDVEELTFGIPVSGTVEYGRMKYYAVPYGEPGLYSVFLSSNVETGVYLFDSEGSFYEDEIRYTGTSAWERVFAQTSESEGTIYVGVFGGTEGAVSEFTLGPSKVQLAFVSDGAGTMEIIIMNPDGANQRSITGDVTTVRMGNWSPDGTKILFTSNFGGDWEVYVINADGSNLTNISNNAASEDIACWSPGGEKILFGSDRNGTPGEWEVFIMDTDGSNPTNLTVIAAGEYGGQAKWSTDGSKVVFVSYRDGNAEIYIMNADGSNQTRLTNDSANDELPDISHDGERIVFQTPRDGNYEVYIMNADGSNQVNITNSPGNDSTPWFSPDGSQIFFASKRTGDLEIFLMDSDGSNVAQITNIQAGDNYFPRW